MFRREGVIGMMIADVCSAYKFVNTPYVLIHTGYIALIYYIGKS